MFQLSQEQTGLLISGLGGITILCALIYGLVTGTFFRWRAIVDCARENHGRTACFWFDLFAEPLHFFVPERFPGSSGGSCWSGCRIACVDHDPAHRLRSSRVGIFTIDGINTGDGPFALGLLRNCHLFRPAVFAKRMRIVERQGDRLSESLDDYLCARACANGDCVAANRRNGANISA